MSILDSQNLQEIRSYLNHINGYSDMLRIDARLSGCTDIEVVFRNIVQETQEIKYTLVHAQCNSTDTELQPVIREEAARHLYVILIQLVHLESIFVPEKHDRFKNFIHEVRVAAYELTRVFENLLDIHADEAFSMSSEEADNIVFQDQQEKPEQDKTEGVIFAAGLKSALLAKIAHFAAAQNYRLDIIPPEENFIDYIHEHDADIILMDIEGWGTGGMFQLELLKKDTVLYSLPVIVISDCTDPDIIIKSIELGAEDFMPSDYTEILLKARIKAAIAKKAKTSEHFLYVRKLERARYLMSKELSDGVSYVRNMLPQPENKPNLTANWVFLPSLALGGDVFDYRWLSPTQFAVYLIDVSGHGIEASLLSVTVLNVLKSSALRGADFLDPATVLSALNKMFRIEEQNSMYFTAWYGVYNTETRMLTYASAGSQPAIFFPPDSPCENLTTHGLIIGLDPDVAYTNGQRFISPRSSLYVFSDGVFEIRKRNKQMMNLQEFTEILSTYAPAAANDPQGFVARIAGMSEHNKFEDDVSFIEIHFPD